MPDFKTLAPQQALIERSRPEVKLVDVRTVPERREQHIPGSLHIPLQEFVAHYREDLSTQDEIILYCQHGVRSKQAALFLTSKGYADVAHMAGGLSVWNGPLESE